MSFLNMLLEFLTQTEVGRKFHTGDRVKIVKPEGSYISDLDKINGKLGRIIGTAPLWDQPVKDRKAYKVKIVDDPDYNKEYIVFDDEMELIDRY